MRLPKKRQQMMLAQAEKFDILHQDHLVVTNAEGSPVQKVIDVLVIPAGQKFEGLLITLWRLPQSLALRILADQPDNLAHVTSNCLRITRFSFVEQDFFGWLGHGPFPSKRAPASAESPVASLPCVLETIVRRLFHAYPLQFRLRKRAQP